MAVGARVTLPPTHPFVGMDITTALLDRAGQHPERTFLIWEPPTGGPATWTYGEFARDVAATAAGLAARGVKAGDVVLLHLDNSPGFLLVWFACARLGAVAFDLNTRLSPSEIDHGIGLTGGVGIVTDPRLKLPATTGTDCWRVLLDPETGLVPELMGDPEEAPRVEPDPGAPLCIQLTSGSTAHPKAVLYTHANALWGARVGSSHWRLLPDDVMLVFGPLFHTLALSWQVLASFWVGATVVLMPKYSASRFWEVSLRHRVTHCFPLGITLRTLREQPVPEGHSYRTWASGMEMPMLEETYGVRVFACWGMTEVVTNVITNDLHNPDQLGVVGRCSPEYTIRIRTEDGADAAVGETGELLVGGVRGLSIFAEYVGDPRATADAFDPDGYFLTGDRVTLLPGGAISFAGRNKDMLKVGGENVAALEIEYIIMAVPGVAEAAVIGRPDPMRDEVPVAYVMPHPGHADHQDLAEAIMKTCRAFLADFKVPADLHFLDDLPRVTAGKVDKPALRVLDRNRSVPF